MTEAVRFQNPKTTAKGDNRGYVDVTQLTTLWFNTGSQCNITCENCYMESSPTNDTLIFITADEVARYVDEALQISDSLETIGFTGGEPFLNKDMIPSIEYCLAKGLKVLVLSNAMKPLERRRTEIQALSAKYQEKFVIRVSLDHHTEEGHNKERGEGSFSTTLEQLQGLSADAVTLNIAGRSLYGEDLQEATNAYEKLFTSNSINIAEGGLVIFPEMNLDDQKSPEITTECWGILKLNPATLMCASSRMVVKRKGAETPSVVACTLLPYDNFFDYGPDLKTSLKRTYLKHIYCSQFCVLGGASCSN